MDRRSGTLSTFRDYFGIDGVSLINLVPQSHVRKSCNPPNRYRMSPVRRAARFVVDTEDGVQIRTFLSQLEVAFPSSLKRLDSVLCSDTKLKISKVQL